MSNPKRTCIKISLLGDQSVGKTCICQRFFGLEFLDNNLSSIGIDQSETKMTLENGETVKVKVWDTAGQERFNSISLSTINTSQGVLVVFDLTSRESFKHVEDWIEKIKETKDKVAIVIMGNKCDKEEKRIISKEEAEEYAKKNGYPYFESSAKLCININESFSKVVHEAYKMYGNQDNLDLQNKKKKKSGGGCFGGKKNKK